MREAFLAWSAAIGKILIMDNLRKQHIIVVDLCCMCKRSGEYVDHFLLHCEISSALWTVGLAWVMPRKVEDLLSCRRGLYGSPQSAAVCKIASSCFLWCLWREINDRSIEGQKMMMVESCVLGLRPSTHFLYNITYPKKELKSLFFKTLYHWIVALNYLNLLCFHDFLDFFFSF